MRITMFVTALCLTAASALASDEVFGLWQSEPGDERAYLHVEIAPCADDAGKVCGTIREVFNPTSDANIVGRAIIRDMVSDGPDAWDGGTIWAPDEDETYSSEMELKSANVLEVSGCVLGGLICRGQEWTRVE